MNAICSNVVYFNVNLNLFLKQSIKLKNTLSLYTVNSTVAIVNLFCLLVTELCATFFLLDNVLD